MKPNLQALLVADCVIQDAQTNKRSVIGIFDRLWLNSKQIDQLPTQEQDASIEQAENTSEGVDQRDSAKAKIPQDIADHRAPGSPSAYISMNSVRGTQKFAIRYVYLNDDRVLFEIKFQVNCDNPLTTVQLLVPLPTLPVVGPGIYAMELLCDDDPLGSFRITAIEV